MGDAWAVFLLFAIPIGGGIPAGVILARSKGIGWIEASVIYFLSDVALALVFEPLVLLAATGARRYRFLDRIGDAFRKSVQKTTSLYGNHLGPVALVLVAFGVDPMTGRAAAAAAGHGFVTGWLIAITGDMFYFWLLMASTLWLNSVLGDGTVTTLIILGLMMVVPAVIRRIRDRYRRK